MAHAPNDKYEKEADRVAEAVMRMPEPEGVESLEEDEEQEQIQMKSAGQYKPETLNGKRLLAHELTHVAQGKAGRFGGETINRHTSVGKNPSVGERLLRNKEFRRELLETITALRLEVANAVNPKSLLYNPDWANRPLGSVISETTWFERHIFRGRFKERKYKHSRPEPGVAERGLVTKSQGFTGGYEEIKDAIAVAVVTPPRYREATLSAKATPYAALSKRVGAPFFVLLTRESKWYLFESGKGPVSIVRA